MDENQTNELEVSVVNDEVELRNKTTRVSDSSRDGDPHLPVSEKRSTLPAETKLEGWLKLAGVGFRKTGKQVWVVYGEDTGKLYYYVHPQDIMPAGEIDLRCSSLTYDASNRDKQGLFEIRSGGKIYSIDAQENVHKLNWLEALQKKRRAFSLKQAELAQDLLTGKNKHLNIGGLLGQESVASNRESFHSVESHQVETGNMISTIQSHPAERNTIDSDLSSTACEDCLIVSERLPPPSSLALMNNFNIQWHVNCDESPLDSRNSDLSFISCDSQNVSDDAVNSFDHSDEYKTFPNQSGSSQTLTAVKSKQLPSGDNQSIATSLLSPPSTSSTNGKLKFMSVLRNNFKMVKDTVKEKKMNMTVKYLALTSPENSVNISSCCFMCRELGDELLSVKEKLKATNELLETDKVNAGLLQKEMDVMRTVLNTRKECEGKSKDDIIEVLQLKEIHITELERDRDVLMDEKSILDLTMRQNDSELKDLREQISMFQQTMAVKDEMIIQLTNTNHELMNSSNKDLTDQNENTELCFPFPNGSTSVTIDRTELERLTDMCKAYEDQNKFLTKEILELNALRQDDEAREKLLRNHFDSLEAHCCQMSSKYLYLLNEVQTPVRGGEENNNQDIVNQLLQEALDSETESQDDHDECRRVYSSFRGKEYDCYGFLKFGLEGGNILLAKANILKRQSLEIEYQIRNADEETSKSIKWENFMVGFTPSKHLTRSSDLKMLLRQGIPHQFRESVWKGCINLYVRSIRTKNGEKYYKSLEERANNNKSNPAIKQIELDLLRTLPNNKYFDKIDCPGIRKLRRILLCYSIHNPLIGYCQGINRLAAIALLFLGEEDAFWCLVAVTEHLMPGDYYTASLASAQVDQRVLKDLVQERCPKLHAHLVVNDVDLSFFTFSWFLTVFVDGVFPDLFLRVWDVFLYEGSKVLFRFALAFLKYAEDEILKQPNNLAINRCMRALGETITDVRRIYAIAFSELNPFPMRSISSKRNYHLQQVKLELEELEKMRGELRSSQEAADQRQNQYNDLNEDDLDED